MGRCRSTAESPIAVQVLDTATRLVRIGTMRTYATPVRCFLAALALGGLLTAPAAAQKGSSEAPRPDPAIVQDYDPDPAIWLVEDEDTKLYLLGTFHVLPEGFRWRSALLNGIVDQADELIVESSEEDISDAPIMARMVAAIGKRKPVSEQLSPQNRPKWFAMAKVLGIEAEQFDRMPPLMLMFGLGNALGGDASTGASVEYGVETVLEAAFRAAGKPIGSIENAGDVLSSLLDIDEPTLIKELDRELSRWDAKSIGAAATHKPGAAGEAAAMQAMLSTEHSWARGEEVDLSAEFAGAPGVSALFGKRLLDNRNAAWAAWIEQRLAEPGTALIAVGAGHLWGKGSVQDMLARRGIQAERLNSGRSSGG